MGDDERQWFDEARFGMFVHWGHNSQLGVDNSWPLVGGIHFGGMASDAVPIDEYHRGADTFCPEPGAAKQWARLAAEAGMGYGVLTTRHHDGFALWPTTTTDWSIARTPYGGDLVGEYVDAFRAEGLRIGFYLSLSDWHHPDYPAFTEDDKPYPFIAYRRPEPEAWERYLEALFGQVRELLTDYGQIDVLWFDGQWERFPDEWRAADLLALIRELQPQCLVNDRLPGAGDFESAEQFVPPSPPDHRFEVCMTMGGAWGYVPDDTYKSPHTLIRALCETVGRGGNFLLNVGPRADGSLPPEQVERLEAVAAWMARHREAIVGTVPGYEPWQFYGPSTARPDGSRTYVVALDRPREAVTVRGVPVRRVERVVHVATGTELPFTSRTSVVDELLNADPPGELTIPVTDDLVDDLATVLAVDLRP